MFRPFTFWSFRRAFILWPLHSREKLAVIAIRMVTLSSISGFHKTNTRTNCERQETLSFNNLEKLLSSLTPSCLNPPFFHLWGKYVRWYHYMTLDLPSKYYIAPKSKQGKQEDIQNAACEAINLDIQLSILKSYLSQYDSNCIKTEGTNTVIWVEVSTN